MTFCPIPLTCVWVVTFRSNSIGGRKVPTTSWSQTLSFANPRISTRQTTRFPRLAGIRFGVVTSWNTVQLRFIPTAAFYFDTLLSADIIWSTLFAKLFRYFTFCLWNCRSKRRGCVNTSTCICCIVAPRNTIEFRIKPAAVWNFNTLLYADVFQTTLFPGHFWYFALRFREFVCTFSSCCSRNSEIYTIKAPRNITGSVIPAAVAFEAGLSRYLGITTIYPLGSGSRVTD